MTLICGECGHEIPDGMDFCPHCGCMAGSGGVLHQDGGLFCSGCGAPCGPGDRFCGKCGAPIGSTYTQPRPVMRKNGQIAILLALIPGFFNIFGLGHILLKSYSRGAMFLAMSLIIWYVNDWNLYSSSLVFTLLGVAVYFYQAMDVLRVAYAPEEK